jgi:O-antigen/teichoic acid export membrane protein
MADNLRHDGAIKSSAIIGSASLVNMVLGLVKVKLIAVLLGPTGIGLLGLLQNVVSTASVLASFGINNVGTRQIAEAIGKNSPASLATTVRALFFGGAFLSIVGFFGFLVIIRVFPFSTDTIGGSYSKSLLLAVAVSLTVASSSQIAFLTGLRKIKEIALISISSAFISSAFGVILVWLFGLNSIAIVILLTPLTSVLAGAFFVQKPYRTIKLSKPDSDMPNQLKVMARLGFLFMIGGLVSTSAQLMIRSMVHDSLGVKALGEFQASWQISMLYLGFVLGAMGTDFYPRLTATIKDKHLSTQTVNEQTELAILLSAPALLFMLGAGPWVVSILYSSAFNEASEILGWQILGDALRLVSWPIGFVLLATGDGNKFLIAETVGYGTFVLSTWILLPYIGVAASGIGFLLLYIAYLPTVYCFASKSIGFKWTRKNLTYAVSLLFVCIFVKTAMFYNPLFGSAIGLAFSLASAVYAFLQLTKIKPTGGLIGKLVSKFVN